MTADIMGLLNIDQVNKLTKGLKNGLLYDETVHFLYIKFTK